MVHMLQFNGKQGEVNAMRAESNRPASAATSNLRCPRNGKRTNASLKFRAVFSFHHEPLSVLNTRLGRR